MGLAVLTGDGRINVTLDALIVDEKYRRQGIGGKLLETVIAKAEALQPHYFQTDVHEQSTERFYAKFGFVKNKGTWILEHKDIATSLNKRARKVRRKNGKS